MKDGVRDGLEEWEGHLYPMITWVESSLSLKVVLWASASSCSGVGLGGSKFKMPSGSLLDLSMCQKFQKRVHELTSWASVLCWAGGHHGELRYRNCLLLPIRSPRVPFYSQERNRWLLPDLLSLIVKI